MLALVFKTPHRYRRQYRAERLRRRGDSKVTMYFFGQNDPRQMPRHLFSHALQLDYSTAEHADISKQNFSICPRHWYIDASFRCTRCDRTFVFTAAEQRFWYEDLSFWVDSFPRRCVACRHELRELKSLRQEYDRDVTAALARDIPADRKQRLVDLLDALDQHGITLPEKTQEHRRTLLAQLARLHREDAETQ